MVRLGEELTEGKTKIVYAHPTDAALCYLVHQDGITAGDGAKRHTLPGKGVLAGRTTANVFRLVEKGGVTTHFLDTPQADVMLVKRCEMIPLEIVMRRIATGSYLRRHPETEEGSRFNPPLVEYFLKDDARHDPQMMPDEIVREKVATGDEVAQMAEIGRRVFLQLEKAWVKLDVQLVDLKIEFGNDGAGSLLVADVVDNDSWRIWPGGEKSRMLDKQVYRNMAEVTEEGVQALTENYAQVADLTDRFLTDK